MNLTPNGWYRAERISKTQCFKFFLGFYGDPGMTRTSAYVEETAALSS